MGKTQNIGSKLERASKDDLLLVVGCCESFYATQNMGAEDEKFKPFNELKTQAVEVLRKKYGLDNPRIKKSWKGFNDEVLRREYDESYCSQCLHSPGFKSYERLGGVLSCEGPKGLGRERVYNLPITMEKCVFEIK